MTFSPERTVRTASGGTAGVTIEWNGPAFPCCAVLPGYCAPTAAIVNRGPPTFLAKTVILRGAMQCSQAQTWKSLDIHFHPDRRKFAQLIRAQAADFSEVIF
jgi:hypothetical protein